MATESDADRLSLFALDGVTATFGADSLTVLFDGPMGESTTGINTKKARATARTSDLDSYSIVEDSATPLIISGTSYTVRRRYDDGEGMSYLALEAPDA